MPQIIPAAMAAFAAVKGAVATVMAIKVLGITIATWGKVAMWTAMGASMLMKPPGLPSSGMQVNLQPAGPDAPLPIILGRTGVQGMMTYREAYPDAVHNSDKNNKLCFESVISVGPIKSISNYTLTGQTIFWDRDPTRLGSSTGVSICRGVGGFDAKSSVWKDGVRAAFILGEHTDQRTARDITGDINLPNVTPDHKMSGLARMVQVFELDGSKNLRFPMGFPDDVQAIAEGIFAWNPRLDSTYPGGSGPQRLNDPATWGWSENPYILALAYILGRKGPTDHKMWGIGADPEDIDIPAFVHGANVADLNGWKVGGMITTDDNKDAVLSNILAAGAGQYLPGPEISCFVNEPKVSTFTLKQSMLIGDQVIRATRPMKGRFNRILVKYREPNQNYEIVTGQDVSDAGMIATDGGLRTTETTYPLIQNATQAHQIAAYELVNSREYEVDVRITAEGLATTRGDLITVDFPIGAIESQNFIIKNWSFDAASQSVDLTLVSETAGKHDFALGRTAVAPVPAQPKSTTALNPPAPSSSEWALVANQLVQERPVVEPEEGEEPVEPLAPATTPAFVFRGAAQEPAIHGIVVEVRPFDADRANRIPGESNDAYEVRQDAGWMVAFEAPSHSEQIVVRDVAALTTYDIAISYRSNLGVISPRLIFGERTTGALSVDWFDPDVFVNRPSVFTDLENGEKIKAEFIALAGDADRTLQEALDDLKAAQDGVEEIITEGLALRDGAIADARAAAEGALDLIGRDDSHGLRNRVKLIEETGPDGTLVGRIELLEDIGENHETRITNAVTSVTNLEGTTAQSLFDLNASLNTEKARLNGQITKLDQVKLTADGAATASALAAVALTQTTEKGRLDGQVTKLDQVKLTADGAATASALSDVILTQTTEKGRLDGQVTKLDQVKLTADGAATASALAAVKLTQDTEKARLDGEVTRLDQVKATADGAATASALATVALLQSTEKARLDGQVTRLDQVKATADGAATASALATVKLTQDTEKARLDGEVTRLDQVKITADNAATVSSINTLNLKVDGYDGRITTAQEVASDALGRINSKYGVVLGAGNKIAGFQIDANTTSSTFDVLADKFRISDGTSSTPVFTYAGGVLTAGSLRLTGSININNLFVVDEAGNMTQKSATSGARKEETNQLIQIFDANRLRVRVGIW